MHTDVLRYVSEQYMEAFQSRLQMELVDGVWRAPRVPPPLTSTKALYDDIHDLYNSHFDDMAHQLHTDGKTIIQGVGYGLIDDFRLFVNVGLLYSNRIILWDFAWGRLLTAAATDVHAYNTMCSVIANVLDVRGLVASDGICILPHPSQWSRHTSRCLEELRSKPDMNTPPNFGLVSALSVCDTLNVHPYTLYDRPDVAPRVDGAQGFLTQGKIEFMINMTRLMGDEPFAFIKNIDPTTLHSYLKETPEFFRSFREAFVIEGADNTAAERKAAFDKRKDEVLNALRTRNQKLRIKREAEVAETLIHLGALASIIFGMSSGGILNSAVFAGISSLSARLAKHLAERSLKAEENVLVMGFSDLQKKANGNKPPDCTR